MTFHVTIPTLQDFLGAWLYWPLVVILVSGSASWSVMFAGEIGSEIYSQVTWWWKRV